MREMRNNESNSVFNCQVSKLHDTWYSTTVVALKTLQIFYQSITNCRKK